MTASKKATAIDMDRALLDPGSVFATPEDILRHDGLSKEQKIEILRRWEYDASGKVVSVNYSDFKRRVLLDAVLQDENICIRKAASGGAVPVALARRDPHRVACADHLRRLAVLAHPAAA